MHSGMTSLFCYIFAKDSVFHPLELLLEDLGLVELRK